MQRFLLVFVLSITGCSFGISSSPADSDLPGKNEALKLDIFAARGFLGGSEYERYHLEDKVLWKECGSVSPAGKAPKEQKNLEGDEVLSKDPQLSIQERRVEKLDSDQLASIREKAWELLTEREKSATHNEPPPGSVFSLSAPGVFEMFVNFASKKERIISSVDAVADMAPSLDKAHELFSLLRGVGPEICGVRTFYGIERK